jgi:hypothetical protein
MLLVSWLQAPFRRRKENNAGNSGISVATHAELLNDDVRRVELDGEVMPNKQRGLSDGGTKRTSLLGQPFAYSARPVTSSEVAMYDITASDFLVELRGGWTWRYSPS